MERPLISEETGRIRFGRHDSPLRINHHDWPLKTAMGARLPQFVRPLKYKQFLFIGITDGHFFAGIAVIDLFYAGKAFFYFHDPETGELFEESVLKPLSLGRTLKGTAEFPATRFASKPLDIHLSHEGILVRTKDVLLDATLAATDRSPLRLCSRTGYTGWTFTRKHAPVPVSGILEAHGRHRKLDPGRVHAITDRTCGYLRRNTFWNWASSAAILEDGTPFGMNLACGVNETGFTENRIWVGDHHLDLGGMQFDIPEKRERDNWRVTDPAGPLDLVFTPIATKAERISAIISETDFVQNMGHFSGIVPTPDGNTREVTRIPGWTEDHYVTW